MALVESKSIEDASLVGISAENHRFELSVEEDGSSSTPSFTTF